MNRKEKILAYIESPEYIPLKFDEMAAVLDVPAQSHGELNDILQELLCEGKIIITKRGRYMAVPADMTAGTIRFNPQRGFAFVIPDRSDRDIYIPPDMTGSALNGDRVLVYITCKHGKNGSPEGKISKVLSRANTKLTGVVYRLKYKYYRIIPDDKKILSFPKIRPGDMLDARPGDRVVLSIIRVDEKGEIYGRITQNLGNSDDINSAVNAITVCHNIKKEFDTDTLAEAEKLPEKPDKTDFSGRLDLRNKTIFTIDGDDAKDFDDAVSIEKTKNGWRLGVHIADVSEYVKAGSALDREAYQRGTSVYFPGRVIPMLPEKLSNGLCSLKPTEDRLTLSVIMEVDKNGGVINHTITESVICSKYRLTYNKVNRLLEGDTQLREAYSDICDDLYEMRTLAEILNEKRHARGSINLDFPESVITTDESGRPTHIGVYERGISNRMIEEFMLLANETVAEYAFWSEIPFIYRVHEAPSYEKITAFKLYAKSLGYVILGKSDKTTSVHPKALESILEQVHGKPEERALSRNLLQSLMKASYSHENLGHFGLAAKYYCHFTSPIRRYPDLAIHRILKSFLHNGADERLCRAFSDFVIHAAVHSSDTEISAQNAERDTEDMMKAYYMSDFIGQSFDGTVSGITSFGMFVELSNTVEGLVRLQNMEEDYFIYDEASMTLTGEHSKKQYKIGDKVTVVLAGCDVISRQIDFELPCPKEEQYE